MSAPLIHNWYGYRPRLPLQGRELIRACMQTLGAGYRQAFEAKVKSIELGTARQQKTAARTLLRSMFGKAQKRLLRRERALRPLNGPTAGELADAVQRQAVFREMEQGRKGKRVAQ
ncbi:MAG TPA: hypothetical protein VGE07_00480 [Herpetosiphonaceae bacterium]